MPSTLLRAESINKTNNNKDIRAAMECLMYFAKYCK